MRGPLNHEPTRCRSHTRSRSRSCSSVVDGRRQSAHARTVAAPASAPSACSLPALPFLALALRTPASDSVSSSAPPSALALRRTPPSGPRGGAVDAWGPRGARSAQREHASAVPRRPPPGASTQSPIPISKPLPRRLYFDPKIRPNFAPFVEEPSPRKKREPNCVRRPLLKA